jgi:hypothetical protein
VEYSIDVRKYRGSQGGRLGGAPSLQTPLPAEVHQGAQLPERKGASQQKEVEGTTRHQQGQTGEARKGGAGRGKGQKLEKTT